MRTVIADKIIYFTKVNYTGCFSNKHFSYVVPWSKLNNITYRNDQNLTIFEFKNRVITEQGNLIPDFINVLNKHYTNGVIIDDCGKVKEML